MIAVRDQENLVQAHRNAAAAKDLNNGSKGIAGKTPANKPPKTPFKIPLNDENAARTLGKSVVRNNGNGKSFLRTGGKKAEADQNAFVTPAGSRIRAPLGMKTTNAKANAFQTPAPPNIDPSPTKTQQKNRSPRLKRAKVKIHQTDEDLLGESEDRDIEIMPQREIPLPDHPEWYSPDLNLDLLQGQSLSRGIWSAINNPVGEDGLTKYEREDAIAKAESDKATDELLKNAIDGCFHDIDAEFAPSPAKETLLDAKPKPATTSTLASKSAASALYRPVHAVPSFALPTANSKAKLPNARPASRKQLSMQRSSAAAPRPHQAAALASRSTIGYSKGRTAPSSVRKPLTGVRSPRAETSLSRGSSQMTITPELFTSTNSNLKNEGFTEEEALRKLQAFSMENDFPESSESERLMFGDDAFDDFQLEVPEL